MSATTKIAVGVAGGYLLGRTKKMRLAITLGSMLAGQRIATNPQALLAQGNKLVESNPELQKLQDEVRGRLMDAFKAAALTTATSRLESITESLRGVPELQSSDEEEEEGEEPEDEYESEEDDEGEEEPEDEDEYDEGEEDEEPEEYDDEEEEDFEEEEPRRRRAS